MNKRLRKMLIELVDAGNKLAEFIQKHPKFVAFQGFIISLIGLWINDAYTVGFGCGVYITAIFYIWGGGEEEE